MNQCVFCIDLRYTPLEENMVFDVKQREVFTCTTGAFSIRDARIAYCSVESVSSKYEAAGEMHAIMVVNAEPPSESCNNQYRGEEKPIQTARASTCSIFVSLLSRYGTCESTEISPAVPLRPRD
jgi:hypothetical protein